MLKNILIRVATSAERYCNEEQKWWSQPASYSKLSPGGPIPHNMAKTFDGPPTLERSGSEHRRAVTSLALLERARAWEWVKDPPAGEGQVGQI